MSRRKLVIKKRVQVDYRFNNEMVERFIACMMLNGKKSISASILYRALDIASEKTNESSLTVFEKAIENARPKVEVKSRRVGGSTYQIPVEVRDSRKNALAIRWIIRAARLRKSASMVTKLSLEFIDAYNGVGAAIKKKEEAHKAAEANKAFSHYRW